MQDLSRISDSTASLHATFRKIDFRESKPIKAQTPERWTLWHEDTTIKPENGFVQVITISPNGKRMAICASDSTTAQIELWDLRTAKLTWIVSKIDGEKRALQFSPRDEFLASATSTTITLWNVATGRNIWSMSVAESFIPGCEVDYQIGFSPPGSSMAVLKIAQRGGRSEHSDQKKPLWRSHIRHIRLGSPVREVAGQLEGGISPYRQICLKPSAPYILGLGHENTLTFWNLDGRKIQTTQVQSQRPIDAIATLTVSLNGRQIGCLWEDGAVEILTIDENHRLETLFAASLPHAITHSISLQAASLELSSNCTDLAIFYGRLLYLWRPSNEYGLAIHQDIAPYTSGLSESTTSVAFSADSSVMVATDWEIVRIWRKDSKVNQYDSDTYATLFQERMIRTAA